MEQHAIPTNVSSYQFKLVGDMTLKQFFQVAGGILGGVIFNATPLLPIIKWPLTIISVLLGVGLAFLPLEERPLEKWIFSFFRAIYSPTVFNWKQGAVSTKLFQDEPTVAENTPQDIALNNYLDKNKPAISPLGNLEKAEGAFLNNLTNIFKTPSSPAQPVTPSVPQPIATTTTTLPSEVASEALHGTPLDTQSAIQPGPPVHEVTIPVNTPTKVQPVEQKVIPPTTQSLAPTNPAVANTVAPVMSGNNMVSSAQAMFSIDAAPPSPPTYSNVVVGQVVDQDRRIVEGVIMEIRDSAGRPIRALRSNKAGHFITVTQLDNGHYEIITEKDGYEFEPLSFEAVGTIIPPILVRGKRLSPLLTMPEVPVKPAYSIN